MSTFQQSIRLAALVAGFLPLTMADAAGTEGDQRLRLNGWTIDTLEVIGADQPGIRHLTVSGRFAVPAESVWQEIAYQYQTGWGINEHESGDTTIARFKIPIPVFRDRHYRLRIVADETAMREDFCEVPGYGNVRSIHGTWQVGRISDSLTRVVYNLETDPGVSLVPSFIIDWLTKTMVPGVYERIYKGASIVASQVRPMCPARPAVALLGYPGARHP